MIKLLEVDAQTLQIPASLTHSAAVRAAARDFFAAAGFGGSSGNRLVLVLDELFMNAVKYGCRPADTVEITLEKTVDGVRCAVTDCGAAGISPAELHAKIENHGATHTPQKTSGRGLAIITHAWTDGYEITAAPTGHLTVSFWKKLAPTAAVNTPPTKLQTPAAQLTVAWAGELDESNLEPFLQPIEEWLTQPDNHSLTLDFAAVSFLNSSVLGQLARLAALLTARGGTLGIQNASPAVFEILDLTGLTAIVPIIQANS